jgi:hypothetical protein
MTWWDKFKGIARREAAAAKEELGRAAEALDEALAKKERELEATPAERVDMLLEEIDHEDAQFGELEAKLRAEGAERADRAGIEAPVPDPPPAAPDHTGIRDILTVQALAVSDRKDRMSHTVRIDGHVLSTLPTAGVDAVVADLLAEVMVLDAARHGDDVLLRAPTLTEREVADLVARVMVHHLPSRSPEVPADPDQTPRDQGYSEP